MQTSHTHQNSTNSITTPCWNLPQPPDPGTADESAVPGEVRTRAAGKQTHNHTMHQEQCYHRPIAQLHRKAIVGVTVIQTHLLNKKTCFPPESIHGLPLESEPVYHWGIGADMGFFGWGVYNDLLSGLDPCGRAKNLTPRENHGTRHHPAFTVPLTNLGLLGDKPSGCTLHQPSQRRVPEQ